MSSPREKNNTKYASDEETSEDTQQQEQPQRRQRRQGNRQMQRRQQGGPLGGLGGGNPTEAVQGVTGGVQNTLGNVAGGALQQGGGGGGDKSDTLRLRLDLNLDIEITLKARIHGDLELALFFQMPVKKEVCRHFLRGSCQFGQRCRYLHVNPQQQRPNNVFGAGAQSASFQPQKSNPYGFGVQNNSQQKPINKPFENTWTRFSPASTGNAPSSRQSENQAQANHKCTDPESCRRIIVEDFEHERPLWKLTCYGHWKNAPCDIVGDISYEELRTAAYDDAKRGLIFQSIVDRERNLLSAKLQEFQNLCKPNGALPNLTPPANQNSFPGTGPNAFAQTPQNNAPTVSSFSQLGASQNVGFGPRPPAPSNNVFVQTNPFGVPSQNSSVFVTKGLSSERQASPFTSPPTIFGNNTFVRAESNPVTPSAVSAQIPRVDTPGLLKGLNSNSNANGEVKQASYTQSAELSGVDVSVWLRTKWSPGEIPEEAPPDAVCS